MPQNLKYTKEHEWVKIKDKTATVGVTDYAQQELGDIVFVDLPQTGKEVKQLEILCEIESVKAVSEIHAPLSGKVIKVNTNLENSPEKVNENPYKEGWITKMEIRDSEELTNLMTAEEYKKFITK